MAKDKLRTIYEDMKEEKLKQLDESLESLYEQKEILEKQLDKLNNKIVNNITENVIQTLYKDELNEAEAEAIRTIIGLPISTINKFVPDIGKKKVDDVLSILYFIDSIPKQFKEKILKHFGGNEKEINDLHKKMAATIKASTDNSLDPWRGDKDFKHIAKM